MRLSGVDGRVSIAGVPIAHLDAWNLTLTANDGETSEFGKADEAFVYTTRGATGGAGGTLDLDDAGQKTIIDMFMIPGTLTVVVLDLINSGAYKFYGSALISNVTVGAPLKDKQPVSFSFKFDGGLYRASA